MPSRDQNGEFVSNTQLRVSFCHERIHPHALQCDRKGPPIFRRSLYREYIKRAETIGNATQLLTESPLTEEQALLTKFSSQEAPERADQPVDLSQVHARIKNA